LQKATLPHAVKDPDQRELASLFSKPHGGTLRSLLVVSPDNFSLPDCREEHTLT
jgi:hypothetical protein